MGLQIDMQSHYLLALQQMLGCGPVLNLGIDIIYINSIRINIIKYSNNILEDISHLRYEEFLLALKDVVFAASFSYASKYSKKQEFLRCPFHRSYYTYKKQTHSPCF